MDIHLLLLLLTQILKPRSRITHNTLYFAALLTANHGPGPGVGITRPPTNNQPNSGSSPASETAATRRRDRQPSLTEEARPYQLGDSEAQRHRMRKRLI
jgi:hypothetical protein